MENCVINSHCGRKCGSEILVKKTGLWYITLGKGGDLCALCCCGDEEPRNTSWSV